MKIFVGTSGDHRAEGAVDPEIALPARKFFQRFRFVLPFTPRF
jgi:hypothetical protein